MTEPITGRNLPPGGTEPPHLHPVMYTVAMRWPASGPEATVMAECAECPRWHPALDAHTAPELVKFTLQHSGLHEAPDGEEVLALLARLTG